MFHCDLKLVANFVCRLVQSRSLLSDETDWEKINELVRDAQKSRFQANIKKDMAVKWLINTLRASQPRLNHLFLYKKCCSDFILKNVEELQVSLFQSFCSCSTCRVLDQKLAFSVWVLWVLQCKRSTEQLLKKGFALDLVSHLTPPWIVSR